MKCPSLEFLKFVFLVLVWCLYVLYPHRHRITHKLFLKLVEDFLYSCFIILKMNHLESLYFFYSFWQTELFIKYLYFHVSLFQGAARCKVFIRASGICLETPGSGTGRITATLCTRTGFSWTSLSMVRFLWHLHSNWTPLLCFAYFPIYVCFRFHRQT